MKSASVVVVGSINHDVSLRVKSFPRAGETLAAMGRSEAGGGKGNNQAVAAARCGARVAMLGAVGDDQAARAAFDLWAAEGIDATNVISCKGGQTGIALIMVDDEGENRIIIDRAANATFSADDVRRSETIIASAAIVVGQLEIAPDATIAAFQIARAAGVTTLLNAAPANEGVPAELLALTDILVVNEIEAAELAGGNASDAPTALARRLLGKVRLGVVMTLGAQGGVFFGRDGGPIRSAAPKVDVVDTTGAGDAFIGAFVARWTEMHDWEEALEWGCVAGSLACRTAGAIPSLAHRGDILDHLAQRRDGASAEIVQLSEKSTHKI